jgi:hypothetical protein
MKYGAVFYCFLYCGVFASFLIALKFKDSIGSAFEYSARVLKYSFQMYVEGYYNKQDDK